MSDETLALKRERPVAMARLMQAAHGVSGAWDEFIPPGDEEPGDDYDEGAAFDLLVEAVTELREALDHWERVMPKSKP